ncbi:MAG: hypothetical protein CVU81_00765 [Euryarchaeota archaeon HGW-Euryarchaeota-1]|nr:MAG: hypothetical protein CVU81_00765 [Euryarchaeota archaeon HGW-Euryarchaeota-1]
MYVNKRLKNMLILIDTNQTFKKNMLILIDTNAWIAGVRQKVDILRELENLFGKECEIIVPSFITYELNKVAKTAKKGADKQAAKIALELIRARALLITEVQPSDRNIDSAIVDFVMDLKMKNKMVVVITNDEILQKRIKKGGGKVVAWKRKKILEFV